MRTRPTKEMDMSVGSTTSIDDAKNDSVCDDKYLESLHILRMVILFAARRFISDEHIEEAIISQTKSENWDSIQTLTDLSAIHDISAEDSIAANGHVDCGELCYSELFLETALSLISTLLEAEGCVTDYAKNKTMGDDVSGED